MKTKNLAIIFILFLLIALGCWSAGFLTKEKGRAVLNETGKITNLNSQSVTGEKTNKAVEVQTVTEKAGVAKPAKPEPIVQLEKTVPPEIGEGKAGQIQATMIINGVEYRTAVKPDSSVYDLMALLKDQKKINFVSENYSGLGFFIKEINGIRNNPPNPLYQGGSGENWIYYVNNKPAQVGVSYYVIKTNDVIEWKFENKSF